MFNFLLRLLMGIVVCAITGNPDSIPPHSRN
jgi:hypothetical protein